VKALHLGLAGSALLAFAAVFAADARAADEARHAAAVRNYDTYCAQCHGLRRNGTGVNSPFMSVKPRDHTDPKAMGDLPDDQIFRAIKEGGLANNRSILMPSFKSVLTDEQITEMVAYLRQVCRCGPSR